MKKYLLILFVGILFVGCSNEPTSLGIGECIYRSGFLWTEDLGADTSYVEQAFNLSFSGFADNKETPKAELLLCDGAGTPLDLSQTEVWANGTKLFEPRVSLPQTDGIFSLKLRSVPSSSTKEGRKDVLLLLCSGTNVDKCEFVGVGDVVVDQAQNTTVGRLHYEYKQQWNTGNLILTWIAVILLALFVVYFIIMRAKHPHFAHMKRSFSIPGQDVIFVDFSGCFEVVIGQTAPKYTLFDRLFKGNARFYYYKAFDAPIVLKPAGKRHNNMLVKTDFTQYSVFPNPIISLQKGEIKIKAKNLKVIIQ